MKLKPLHIAIGAIVAFVIYKTFKNSPVTANPDVATNCKQWRALVEKYAPMFGLPVAFVMGDIAVESGGKPDAVSSSDARGLMQILPSTLPDINEMLNAQYQVSDLFNPEINIRCACAYWAWVIAFEKGNMSLAIRAYNQGVGNIQKDATLGTDYLNKVTAYWNYFLGAQQ